MAKKIVYVVGGLYSLTGMAVILSQKINYLADNTDYDLYMILTESPEKPWYFKMNPRIKWINFDINFDELDTMPLGKKLINYLIKQHKYKRLFRQYLLELKPDITVSAVRRDINFINSIKDGSKKVGEIHFGRTFYRHFDFNFLPNKVNSFLTNIWTKGLINNLRRLDTFVVLTKSDYNNWPELTNKIVIPNFINSFPKEQSKLDHKNVVAVGRYTWQKGFDLLIEAWALIAKNCPDWNLNIYGPGDHELYQRLANEKGLGNCINCHSYAENVYDVYMNSSIFVLSSRYEGFGLVLAEAMASGLPAVSFSCPEGPADIISDHIDGLLVESENVSKLADGILYLINHEKERKMFGINARNNMQRYNKDNIMQEWIRLFDSL